ncbi:MAG: translation initiation factor IF-2 [Patescibacteria group bacterium]|jgi:translation initiation factor IF-2
MSDQKPIVLPNIVPVKDLADKLDVPVTKIIGMLMKNGIMATINENLDFETAAIISEEFGFTAELASKLNTEAVINDEQSLKERPPVVTIMGHVDHGKTTLLDTIRKSNVVASESGGITQHIAAYQVTHNKKVITFLDTPGHAAFTAMRQHGANITDIVVLVIAADDGVKPQTIEAIDHAKLANVPIIVAITKMDQPGANPDRIKQQLAELELVPEDWGGQTVVVPISAKTNMGIDQLLEMILLVAEMKHYQASFEGGASGVVVESHMQIGKGPMATVLVQNGQLKNSDVITVGKTYGKIRTLQDFNGEAIDNALPSQPVVISGLRQLPNFGDQMVVVDTEKQAKDNALRFAASINLGRVHTINKSGLDQSVTEEQMESKELPILVKADVQGSLEAVKTVLEDLGNSEVKINLVGLGVGPVSESDITKSRASKSIVVAFRVPVSASMRQLADKEKVNISSYDVIYDLVEDAKTALSKLLPPEEVVIDHAHCKVIAVFKGNTKSQVIGVLVEDGILKMGEQFRVMRKKEQIGEGKVLGLRRGKEEVKEMLSGQEAGVQIPGDLKIELKDELISFVTEVHTRTL